MITWQDSAADILARKHCLQANYVKKWIIEQRITSDMIKGYCEMPSEEFLEIMFRVT